MAELLGLIQIGLALAQRVFSALLVLDVRADAVPSDHVSALVAQRHTVDELPSILAAGAPETHLHSQRPPRRQALAPCALAGIEIVGVNGDPPRPARGILLRDAGVFLPGPVDEFARAVGPIARDLDRDRVDRHLQVAFGFGTVGLAPPQPIFGALLLLDVRTRPIPSDDMALLVAQRHAAEGVPSKFSVGAPQSHLGLKRFALVQAAAPPGS